MATSEDFRWPPARTSTWPLTTPTPLVAVTCRTFGLKLFNGAKEMGIARHVEQALLEFHMPGVAIRIAVACKHWNAAIDRLCKLRISAAAEDRGGPRVRVDKGEVFWSQREPSFLLVQVLGVTGEEDELSLRDCPRGLPRV